ncbi:D(5)-like dopamine receptor [Holothuria leucospilota]|uniref:D(5)-like dopamine receptor n=1 Tax=Holothuria leucospilota TaxID=206669 RepID=A0A9Q1CJG3_HOLLE|nr:D(5)-like dopamine receptor [Holothuria leucospilota]
MRRPYRLKNLREELTTTRDWGCNYRPSKKPAMYDIAKGVLIFAKLRDKEEVHKKSGRSLGQVTKKSQKYNPPMIDFENWEVNTWPLLVCKFWQSQYIFWSLMGTSTANLIALTLERWIAVVFFIFYRNRFTWRNASMLVVLPRILGFVFQLYWPAVHQLRDGICFPSFRNRSLQTVLAISVFVFKLVLPVLIMLTAYTSLLKRMRTRLFKVGGSQQTASAKVLDVSATSGWTSTANPTFISSTLSRDNLGSLPVKLQQDPIRLNIIKTLLLVMIAFVLCWTPSLIDFLIYN